MLWLWLPLLPCTTLFPFLNCRLVAIVAKRHEEVVAEVILHHFGSDGVVGGAVLVRVAINLYFFLGLQNVHPATTCHVFSHSRTI